MRLDQALVQRNLCESRQEAQELIKNQSVLVDGIVTTKQTKEVTDSTDIKVTARRTYVSRGGHKLEGALLSIYGSKEEIQATLRSKKAIDIGSSTGGFTDCLLSFGVDEVVAVDVGTLQFHPRLRSNPKVRLFENTDIRNFITSQKFDYIVADLSFITLDTLFNAIVSFGTYGTDYFLLIKPQFEVGKGNTKKGIVKDEALVQDILSKYSQRATLEGLHDIQIFPCHIQGGDGNQEYFLYAKQ